MLARRCLHGIVRDFWKTKPGLLVDEIAEIKEKVEPAMWEAIDAVRKVGNFGAHLAENVSEIAKVKPKDVQLLLELIETLFGDWYVTTEQKRQRLEAVKLLGERKTNGKTKSLAAAA